MAKLKEPILPAAAKPVQAMTEYVGSTCCGMSWLFSVVNARSSVPAPTPSAYSRVSRSVHSKICGSVVAPIAFGSIGIELPSGCQETISGSPVQGLSGCIFGYGCLVADPTTAHQLNGSALSPKHQHDPVQWMRFYAERQNDGDPSGFLAMTSLLRLHHLMTTAVEHALRSEFRLALTDYQILKALQLSDAGTWLLSRL